LFRSSSLSRLLTEQINSSNVADVIAVSSIDEARQKMYYGEVQGFFYIENGLEENLLSLRPAQVVLAVNNSRFLPASDLTSAITKICLTVGAGVRLNYFKKTGKGDEVAMVETNPVSLNYKPLFNPKLSYGAFLLPGLLAIILQQTLLIGLAESMSAERQKRKLSDMLHTARGSLSSVLWGKGLWYFILFCAYAFFFLTVNFTILDLPFRGSPVDLFLLMALFLLAVIPMGLWLGSLFKKQLLSMQIMAFSSYPIFI